MPTINGTSGNDTLNGTEYADEIYGFAGNDIINGGAGNDIINGGAGADTMTGAAGDDVYQVDSSSDVVRERDISNGRDYGGRDTINASVSYGLPDFVEVLNLLGTLDLTGTGNYYDNVLNGNSGSNILYGEQGYDTLDGRGGNDLLYGGDDHDTLVGGAGNDTLDGGLGNDDLHGGGGNDVYYVSSEHDRITELAGEGDDLVYASSDIVLAANVERLVMTGLGQTTATGNALDNLITGDAHLNILDGAGGDDQISGGDDADTLRGGAGADRLDGGAGDDTLDGGGGVDQLIGGTGNDHYVVDSPSDTIVENAGEGDDNVTSSFSYELAADLEDLRLVGTAAASATGNEVANLIVGNEAANSLYGRGGDDRLEGGGGNDVLDGGSGADSMHGDAGNDTYYVDNSADMVSDGSGVDTVIASADYEIFWGVENLTLVGTAMVGRANSMDNVITGTDLANRLYGMDGMDTLYGGAGDDILDGGDENDKLYGGAGNDLYIVNSTYFIDTGPFGADFFGENADGGYDIVQSNLTAQLSPHVEELVLTGSWDVDGTGTDMDNVLRGNVGSNRLLGLGRNDVIHGGAGNDWIDGGTGVDRMSGGLGDDQFFVDDVGDTVSEGAGEGYDRVTATADHTLSANIETLTLAWGAGPLTGRGNALGNVITGNAGNNRLFGAAGADTISGGDGDDLIDGGTGADDMRGGGGNDIYIVDNVGDTISDGGTDIDLVRSSVSFVIGPYMYVDNVELTGTAHLTATGNDYANVLTGNSGNNVISGLYGDDQLHGAAGNDTLIGGVGIDRMYGGLGNDTFVVSDTTDYAHENAGEGTDRVDSSITHALRVNIENLTLTGTADINGTGNILGNSINGNSGANRLYGLDGNDYLYGRAGNDRLEGGAGTDRLYGGLGDDSYYVTDSTDYVYEYAGEGNDSVYSSVSHTLRANVEQLYLTGTAASNGTGNALANLLAGNGAANLLRGLGGDDLIRGGGGDDLVEGGAGRDEVYGGTGADQFVFRPGDFSGTTAETADIIRDFSRAAGDRLNLDLVDANSLVTGRQNFTFIGTGAFTGTAGELRYEQADGNTFVSGDTNGDGTADFMIRLDGLLTLTSGDFVL